MRAAAHASPLSDEHTVHVVSPVTPQPADAAQSVPRSPASEQVVHAPRAVSHAQPTAALHRPPSRHDGHGGGAGAGHGSTAGASSARHPSADPAHRHPDAAAHRAGVACSMHDVHAPPTQLHPAAARHGTRRSPPHASHFSIPSMAVWPHPRDALQSAAPASAQRTHVAAPASHAHPNAVVHSRPSSAAHVTFAVTHGGGVLHKLVVLLHRHTEGHAASEGKAPHDAQRSSATSHAHPFAAAHRDVVLRLAHVVHAPSGLACVGAHVHPADAAHVSSVRTIGHASHASRPAGAELHPHPSCALQHPPVENWPQDLHFPSSRTHEHPSCTLHSG